MTNSLKAMQVVNQLMSFWCLSSWFYRAPRLIAIWRPSRG